MSKTQSSSRERGRTGVASVVATLVCLAFPMTATAGTIGFPLNSTGTVSFLSAFPLIELQGSAALPVLNPLGASEFGFDLTVHALVPNGTGSLLTGEITIDFGNANVFKGTLTPAAWSAPPLVDPVTLARTTVLTAPFDITTGTGLFASATGTGMLVLTAHRATDTSPTAAFTSTGSATVSGPAVVPEPSLPLLLTAGFGVAFSLRKARRRG